MYVCRCILAKRTKKSTNLWGSAKRDHTHLRTTVVYNVCYYMIRKRLCSSMCDFDCAYGRTRMCDLNATIMKTAICVMRRRRQVHLSHIFWDKEQKGLMSYTRENETFELPFPKLYTFVKLIELLWRNRNPNMTQNEHVYVICCQLEVGDDFQSKCEDYRGLRSGKFWSC